MENFVQDLLASNISSGVDLCHENHLLENMGEIPHALPSPNPFGQGESLPTDSHTSERQNAIDGGVIQVDESCRCFSLDEVRRATKNFDDALVIGNGGFGKVYKGSIEHGATTTVVAIKRSHAKSNQGDEEFWTEVKLLTKFKHINLVSLIGYCNENKEMILVYEYIACGTLANHLYKDGKSLSFLTWHQRLNICLGAARGLDYLHTGTEQRIIHRDVKSTNILLDENLVAKVGDFGISKYITSEITTHITTKVKGTRGYWDPDYFYTRQVTRRADVYGFGVVLLEVLCGRPPLDETLSEERISLILWAKNYIEKGKLGKIIDPSLEGEKTPHSLKSFADLANKCLHTQPKERPTMARVVESLERALALHESKGISSGTLTEAFRSMKLWWGKQLQPGNGSNNGGGLEDQV